MDAETRSAFIAYFEDLEARNFYGTAEFGVKAGRVYLIKETRTILPEDLLRRIPVPA